MIFFEQQTSEGWDYEGGNEIRELLGGWGDWRGVDEPENITQHDAVDIASSLAR